MLGSLLSSQPPSWVMPGASVDCDFINNRYWNGYVDQGSGEDTRSLITDNGSYGSLTTGLIPYTPQANGILLTGLESQNRITDLGLFSERGAVNNCLYSRDLTQSAWVATTATVAKNQIGNDTASIASGSSTCSSITATASNATVLQSISLSSRVVIFSAYVKRITGSGTVKITSDGSTWTDVTSQLSTTGYAWVQNGQQTLSSVICGFQLGTSGDAIAVDFCQLETSYTGQYANLIAGDKATTPLVTTTASVTRGNNVAYWQNQNSSPIGGHGNNGQRVVSDTFSGGNPWSMLASFNGDIVDGSSQSGGVRGPIFIASDMTVPTSITCGGGTVGFGNNFTTKTSNVCNLGRGNWNIAGVTCNGKGTTICLNAGAIPAINTGAGTTPNANSGSSHFNIFNNGSGAYGAPLNGSCGRVTFFEGELSAGQLTEWTNLNGPYRTF